jgi:hypothetical protein
MLSTPIYTRNVIKEEMKPDFILFEKIWWVYCNILPIEQDEFDIYLNIINKIKKNDFDFNEENIEDFNDFLNIMIDCIYTRMDYAIGMDYEEEDNINETLYDDNAAFICCEKIKKYLNKVD